MLPWIALLAIMLLLFPAAQAHVPLIPGENENLSSPTIISDPEKSWAAYGFLRPDTPQYYAFNIDKGQRIYLSLLASTTPQEQNFSPSFALMGPGLNTSGDLPGYVEVPEGYGAIAVEGIRDEEASYEPFGPSSYYGLGELDMDALESGAHFVAVYGPDEGHYSLVIGYREEFSLMERITSPLRLISVYQWEGQGLLTILMPWMLAFLVGLYTIRRARVKTAFRSAGTMAGFLFLGTSASNLAQMVFNLTRAPAGQEAVITLILVLFPAILGVVAIRLAWGQAGILQRSMLAAIGTIGLLAGSGLIIGPLLAIAASVLPSRKRTT